MPDVYIDTDNAAGGRDGSPGNPYSTWDEAWEAEDTNIDPGETWNFFFKGTTQDTLTSANAVIIDGWPTAGAGDVTLNFEGLDDGTDGWYKGDNNFSTSHYRLVNTSTQASTRCLEIIGDDETTDARTVNIQNLQFRNTGGNTARCINIEDGTSGTVTIDGNRLSITSTGTNPRVIRGGAITSAVQFTAFNNLVTYNDDQNCSTFNFNDGQYDLDIHNNTIYYSDISGGEDTIDDVSGMTTDAENNAVFAAGGGTFCEFDAGTITKDYNAHTNSADRGANGFAIVTGDFTTPGTGDTDVLTPATSQTNAWGSGGQTNGDNSKVPLIDIRGNARNSGAGGNTAIGCFAAAGEGTGDQTMTASLFVDADVFPASTVAQGSVDVTASLFADPDTFPAPSITAQFDLVAAAFSDPDVFFGPTVTTVRDLVASLFADADIFSAHTVDAGNTLTATLFTDPDTFNAHTVAPGALSLIASLFSNVQAFGAHTVTPGDVSLAAALYSDPDTFGAHLINTGLALAPDLFVDPDAFPAHTIAPGSVGLTAALFTDPDAFLAASVTTGFSLTAPLFVDGDAFPAHTVDPGAVTLVASAFIDPDTFPLQTTTQELFLTASLYADADVFSFHQVLQGDPLVALRIATVVIGDGVARVITRDGQAATIRLGDVTGVNPGTDDPLKIIIGD